jgi:phenylacetate-CoA ligase
MEISSVFLIQKKIMKKLKTNRTYKRVYNLAYKQLQDSRFWSEEERRAFQLHELRKILRHAYDHTIYYRRLFDECGIDINKIHKISDIEKIPFLTRELVTKHHDELIADNYKKEDLIDQNTGGTTGHPLTFVIDIDTHAKHYAHHNYGMNLYGYDPDKDKIATFTGVKVPKKQIKKYRYGYRMTKKRLVMSSYDISDETISEYVDTLNKYMPDYLMGYPSVVFLFAKCLEKNNLNLNFQLKGILCNSEGLYRYQREFLSLFFKCKVYLDYGHQERAVFAMPCEQSNWYHLVPLYGICEVIKEDGSIATNEGERGEIVATGFVNYAFPFISYKTGDIATITTKKCSCRRNWKLLSSIEGRVADIIITKDNTIIQFAPMLFGSHFKAYANIIDFQVCQDEIGKLRIRIVRGENYTQDDEIALTSGITSSINLDIVFEYVDSIDRTEMGKHRYVVQKLKTKFD